MTDGTVPGGLRNAVAVRLVSGARLLLPVVLLPATLLSVLAAPALAQSGALQLDPSVRPGVPSGSMPSGQSGVMPPSGPELVTPRPATPRPAIPGPADSATGPVEGPSAPRTPDFDPGMAKPPAGVPGISVPPPALPPRVP